MVIGDYVRWLACIRFTRLLNLETEVQKHQNFSQEKQEGKPSVAACAGDEHEVWDGSWR